MKKRYDLLVRCAIEEAAAKDLLGAAVDGLRSRFPGVEVTETLSGEHVDHPSDSDETGRLLAIIESMPEAVREEMMVKMGLREGTP